MRFTVKSEQEILQAKLLPEGQYRFLVTKAEDTVSKNGNEMIKMYITVWSHEGHEHFMFDYLLEAMAYKLRHFAEATGLLDKYETGELNAADCERKEGVAEISIEPGSKKSDGTLFPPRNSIKDYLRESTQDIPVVNRSMEVSNELNDDIPF